MENNRDLESRIENTKNWLLYSGIQNLDSSALDVKGGFNSWYDIDKENYFYAYSEAAGYGISTLLYLNSIGHNNLYLLRSVLAAEWILDKASHKGGGLKTRYYFDRENAPDKYDFSSGVIHSFDNGIALSGLTELYKVTKEQRYLKTAKKIGNFLIDVMQKEDGNLYAKYSYKDDAYKDSYEKWSTQSGSFHAKVALGLLKLYDILKDDKYKDAVIKLCNNSLRLQEPDGRFISYKPEKDTHLHPHCYSAEGLLFSGLYLEDTRYLRSAVRATEWALNTQMENGGIPSMYVNNNIIEHERSDVLAQVLRLGTIMLNMGLIDKKYKEKLEKLKNRLFDFQCKSQDSKSNGGFLYGYDIDYRNGLSVDKKNHLNSWCTMFSLQALIMYKQYLENRLNVNLRLFV